MKTILVVDDNSDVREEICDIFKMEKFNVIEAVNGNDAFSKAVDKVPDLIVSDIIMPDLDGFELFEKLKDHPKTDTIPVIFLSALSDQYDIRKGMNLGVDDYLTKPVISEFLIKAVKNKIEKYSKVKEKLEHLKTNIIEVLHHELRTPLNGIIGFSDFLTENIDKITREEIKDYLLHIRNSGYRLHKLIEKYLKFVELKMISDQEGMIDIFANTPFIDTDAIIIETVQQSSFFLERKNDIKLNLSLVKIKMDPLFFKSLIEELIENAYKFSFKENHITVTSDVNDNRFKIKIFNEGLGMKKEDIPSISDFKQFNRQRFAQNGSGIGLSIVRMIAELYNIELNFISEYGTYFSVTIIIREIFKLPDT